MGSETVVVFTTLDSCTIVVVSENIGVASVVLPTPDKDTRGVIAPVWIIDVA